MVWPAHDVSNQDNSEILELQSLGNRIALISPATLNMASGNRLDVGESAYIKHKGQQSEFRTEKC